MVATCHFGYPATFHGYVCYKLVRRLWVSCHISWICVLPQMTLVEAWGCFFRGLKPPALGKTKCVYWNN